MPTKTLEELKSELKSTEDELKELSKKSWELIEKDELERLTKSINEYR